MQHNDIITSEGKVTITASIREKAAAIYEQLQTMEDIPTLLMALRSLRMDIIRENRHAQIDAYFILEALKQAGFEGRPLSANSAHTLRHVCYAISDKVSDLASTSHKLMVEDFGSVNSVAENLLTVLSVEHDGKKVGLVPQYEDKQLAVFVDNFVEEIQKELKPRLDELEEKRGAYLNKLNRLFKHLEMYNSSFMIKASSSLRIKSNVSQAFTKKEGLEKYILELSKEVWLGPDVNAVYGPLAEMERDFFYKLMRQYDNFFSRSKQYEYREVLSVSPFFRLETLRFDALKIINKKMKAMGQKENKSLLETAKNSIANMSNSGAIVVKLEELKKQYKPRKGFFSIRQFVKSDASEEGKDSNKKDLGLQTEFYQLIADVLIKYRHLESKGRELEGQFNDGREKGPEERRSPSPSRREF